MTFLARVQSFKIECSRDEVYFPKLSGRHTTVAMHHIHDVTKPLMTLLLHYEITWSVVAGDVSNEDLLIIENNQFTNLIE